MATPPPPPPPLQATTGLPPPPVRRKILIVGASVAGLTLALAVKRASALYGLGLEPVVFEKRTTFTEANSGPPWLMWRWALQPLLELGLGKRLQRIAMPIHTFHSVDAETRDVLVQWPPAGHPHHDPARAAAADAAADGPPSARDAGACATGADALPPLVAIRQCDLVRILLLALAEGPLAGAAGGDPDAAAAAGPEVPPPSPVRPDVFAPAPANNSHLGAAPEADVLDPLYHSPDADLACGAWLDELEVPDADADADADDAGIDMAQIWPHLHLGYELDSFLISATTGTVTARFANGFVEHGAFLVGCDGAESRTRDILLNAYYPPQYAGAAIFSGLTRLHLPPHDFPTEFENGAHLPDISRDALAHFCPPGQALSLIGRGLSFGVIPLGNGLVGWNLVVTQAEAGQHRERLLQAKRRFMIGAAVAASPAHRSVVHAPSEGRSAARLPGTGALDRVHTDTTGAEDKWAAQAAVARDAGGDAQADDASAPGEAAHPSTDAASGDDDRTLQSHHRPAPSAAAQRRHRSMAPGALLGAATSARMTHARRLSRPRTLAATPSARGSETDHEAALRKQLEIHRPSAGSVLNDILEVKDLSGTELRQLVLTLAQPLLAVTSPSLPPRGGGDDAGRAGAGADRSRPRDGQASPGAASPTAQAARLDPAVALALMARCDPSLLLLTDVQDLADGPPVSITSPNFQAGRVLLLGDAAHPVAPAAHGSVGGGLAVTDSVLLAKLLVKHFDPHRPPAAAPAPATAMPDSGGDEMVLKHVAREFDMLRHARSAEAMRHARQEGAWNRTENSWVRSLWKLTYRYAPRTWAQATYTQLLTLGAIPPELPSLHHMSDRQSPSHPALPVVDLASPSIALTTSDTHV
ncbi:hypothetical protein CXG81DRAFT_28457 [Caulochytrium protostelioides]|uniref:FAD-binding domain-containing protein n=1 Tax=Caulochytrium protostelioides TaxID=1555241 RepID=A0A4V1ITZ1_9FUNG|nr:hypothetical protein CXG81DRAFT_28457 [Caulochytrium protostelioides]|eukprot:RKO98737.1 hypothetical protein CXG81DRAFT_28457 [Caulochytrium protostelioides]